MLYRTDAKLYELFAIIVHVGSDASHGHYVSIVRKGGAWHLYDDMEIQKLNDSSLESFFGCREAEYHHDGYMLFYSVVEEVESTNVDTQN